MALNGVAEAAPQRPFSGPELQPVRQVANYLPDDRMVQLSTLSGFVRDNATTLSRTSSVLLFPDPGTQEKVDQLLNSMKPAEAVLAAKWELPGFRPLLPRATAGNQESGTLHKVPVPASAQMLFASVLLLGSYGIVNRPAGGRAHTQRTRFKKQSGKTKSPL